MHDRCQIGKVLQAHGLLHSRGVLLFTQYAHMVQSTSESSYTCIYHQFSLTATGNPISHLKNASLSIGTSW